MITLNLTLEETNVVLQALGQLPYDQIAPLLDKMRKLGEAQLQPKPVPLNRAERRALPKSKKVK